LTTYASVTVQGTRTNPFTGVLEQIAPAPVTSQANIAESITLNLTTSPQALALPYNANTSLYPQILIITPLSGNMTDILLFADNSGSAANASISLSPTQATEIALSGAQSQIWLAVASSTGQVGIWMA